MGATCVYPDRPSRDIESVGVLGRAPRGAMLYRSVGGDVSGWPIFDAAAPVLPDLPRPQSSCSRRDFLKLFHRVWRESTKRRHFSKLSLSPGAQRFPSPIMANFER